MIEETDFYCSEHDRYFSSERYLKAHKTKSHRSFEALTAKSDVGPFTCKHKFCIERSFNTKQGLTRHNTYMEQKAVMEGRHELTVEEHPQEDFSTAVVIDGIEITPTKLRQLLEGEHSLTVEKTQPPLVPAEAFFDVVTSEWPVDLPSTEGLPVTPRGPGYAIFCVRQGKIFVWAANQWREHTLDDLVGAVRLALSISS